MEVLSILLFFLLRLRFVNNTVLLPVKPPDSVYDPAPKCALNHYVVFRESFPLGLIQWFYRTIKVVQHYV